MDFYHGTTVGGLTELIPFASPYASLKEPRVYLTTSKQLALHYIWDTDRVPVKMPMLDIRKDGVLVFQEMFSGALQYFYAGLHGYIYHCVGDYALDGETGVFTCATSNGPVAVQDVEVVDDVYERIVEYGRYGTFIYEKYEELPAYRYDIIRGHIMRGIKRENLLENPEHPLFAFYHDKFPQYMREADILRRHGLF